MAKKRPGEAGAGKVVVYVEVAPWVKQALEALAVEHHRSLTGEATVAFEQYIEAHKKEKGGAK
jgi:hypothetical protein